ncbi:protein tyrosine/serine phosphatase-like protein [Pseudooceanicola batsensis HTCC2597]|uniref:Protein tyrosine/serine phosphatase-like protein n=1 Tax=Pseudooceanicola batsensis (strain ATCC BAA-863 / DSM 15984 / KCTC 12145 / HTCC2597) TaxID=252305 RepID=A3U190_PSEBH|nr:tyrosine-protein phosphatase [Pseudooceanicola batsensis]EAQ02073.1 protein tyrosine/serine phosphatase-like protein [Pseudooceanicola batsensis HTCC2597]
MTQTRVIPLNGTFNLRDLGGYPGANGETTWRRLLRADSLHRLTQAEMGELRHLGCSTVIDLRGPDEVSAQPNPFGSVDGPIAYHNISLFSGLDPTRTDLMEADDVLFALYCAALDDCGPSFAEVLRLIAEAPGLVVFHCTAGKDRTGMIAAFLLLLAGTPRDRIVADYALTAAHAPAMFAALQAELTDAGRDFDLASPLLLSNAATMDAFLEHLDAVHGGAETYLMASGLTETDLAALRARMLRAEPEEVA